MCIGYVTPVTIDGTRRMTPIIFLANPFGETEMIATQDSTAAEIAEMVSDILSDTEADGYGLDKDDAEAVVRHLLFNPSEFAEFLYTYHKDFNSE